MLVVLVNIYKSLIIYYLLLLCGLVRTSTIILFEGNVSQIWKLWLKDFEFYLTATKKDVKNDKVKTSVLMTCAVKKAEKSMKLLILITLVMK